MQTGNIPPMVTAFTKIQNILKKVNLKVLNLAAPVTNMVATFLFAFQYIGAIKHFKKAMILRGKICDFGESYRKHMELNNRDIMARIFHGFITGAYKGYLPP